jgi:hypothetical protein
MNFFKHKSKQIPDSDGKGINEVSERLEEANRMLVQLNRKLQEANLVKEKYVGYFLHLCSQYVGELEDFQLNVANKIAINRINELQRVTSSYSEKSGKNKKMLHTHFDSALLAIYPDFVSSINGLLTKETQFVVEDGELNTELRIFALIRLGITDSEKIASILFCSVQTVRNYRSKIKRNCIIENPDEIEEVIKKIDNMA